MEKVIAYKANNGRLFETAESCLKYEAKLAQYPKVKVETIQSEDYMLDSTKYPTPVVKCIESKWEKPNSQRKNSISYIVANKYRITPKMFPITSMDLFLIGNYPSIKRTDRQYLCWDAAPRYFAEVIILGCELTDETVIDEIVKINLNNSIKLDVEVLEPNKKWYIENPCWKTGGIAPRTFEIEKL